jgi:DNA invertase Pin-like site-specific DNA recombinase
MPKAYSYARWSRPQQGLGDTLRRQLELSRAYAAEYGLEVDETFRDPGMSSYRGQNHTEGALGNFIKQIDIGEEPRGRVKPGDYLLVESLDRLSREKVLSALELFMGIIRRGVKIVTLTNGYLFDTESINANPALLMVSIVEMMRAHEESRMKGERVATANENKRRRARENRVPMTSLCPGWLRLVRNGHGFERARYEINPERAAVVRRIYQEGIAGFGKRRIAKRLNGDGIPAFRGRDGWHESSVGKILETEAVLGVFQPHRKVGGKRIPDGPPIPGYFPAIVDEATFWQAQEAVRSRRIGAAGRKGDEVSNLFSGIGVCDECNANLRYIDKGPKPKGGQYLACQRALRHLCQNGLHYPYPPLEEWLLHTLGGMIGIGVLTSEEAPKPNEALARGAELEAQLARRTDARKRFIEAFRDDTDPVLIDEIRNLGNEIKQIEAQLGEARRAAKMDEHADRRDIIERIIEARGQLASEDKKERELARTKLAQHFKRAIGSMRLRGDRHVIVQSVPDTGGKIDEYDFDAGGELAVIKAIHTDGSTTRFGASVFQVVFPPFEAGIAEQTIKLFAARSARAPLTEQEYLDQVLQSRQMMEGLTLRHIGGKDYEVILRDAPEPEAKSGGWNARRK